MSKLLSPVCIVPLGPGAPSDLTLGSLERLREADYIFCPATVAGDSKARRIMLAVGIHPEQIQTYTLPMSKEREPALQAYDMVAEKASILYQAGKRIAITAEGDAGIYSSSGYILGRLNDLGVETVRTAGIPAFVAAAALAKVILTEGEESLLILPSVTSAKHLLSQIESGTTVVLMKCSQSTDVIKEAIHQGPHLSWHYFESIGYSEEFHTTDQQEILSRPFPYFSLIIVRR
ncbi:MAG: precorrin-2 C(20)-methyltransferase [Porphyromonas sp.]|nr:precorrin-2 C(20)-methyltransferase [Porphyromonas sp.]